MSCNITSGITTGCNTGIGGVKNIWLANSTSGPWYKYEMDKETASLVETYNVNQAGGILGFTQTLTIQLNKMAADKQQQIALIAEANGMQVVVETNDGKGFQFGQERGAYLASGTSTSGTAYTDTNQSELVIQADSKEPMSIGLPGEIVGTLFLHVYANDVKTLGVCEGLPAEFGNGYISAPNIVVDTYGAWDFYDCDELWFSTSTILDTTKDVIITGEFRIETTLATTQQEWDVVYNSALGVNTSNSPNFPPRAPEPVFFAMSTVLPAQLPATPTGFDIKFSKNVGPITPPSPNHSYQSFGVALGNYNIPPVTGPWTQSIKQQTSVIKAYLA